MPTTRPGAAARWRSRLRSWRLEPRPAAALGADDHGGMDPRYVHRAPVPAASHGPTLARKLTVGVLTLRLRGRTARQVSLADEDAMPPDTNPDNRPPRPARRDDGVGECPMRSPHGTSIRTAADRLSWERSLRRGNAPTARRFAVTGRRLWANGPAAPGSSPAKQISRRDARAGRRARYAKPRVRLGPHPPPRRTATWCDRSSKRSNIGKHRTSNGLPRDTGAHCRNVATASTRPTRRFPPLKVPARPKRRGM
jgi:hypothetical protein